MELIPAVAYARVSTESQADDELPITAQIDEIKRFAHARGYRIIESFIDAGITGRIEERPEFSRLRKIISSGDAPFNAVIVWRSNRFARSARIAQGFRFLLEQKGIKLFSCTEPELNGSVGVLMNGILDAFNEFYSAQLGEDTFRGMIASAKAGYVQGGVSPYGLKRVQVVLDTGAIKKKYAINPQEAPTVREIYNLYANENKGLYQIARHLNTNGMFKRNGKEWDLATIHHILFFNRQYYLGNTIFNRTKTLVKKRVTKKPAEEWIITENTHEAIIDKETSDKVDKQLKGANKPRFQKVYEGHNLLNGLMFCGNCGRRYSGTTGRIGKAKTITWYYACTERKNSLNKDKSKLCSSPYIRQEIIDNAVLAEIKRYFYNPESIKQLIKSITLEIDKGNEDKKQRETELLNELQDIEKRKENLFDAIEKGTIKLSDINERLEKLKNRATVIEIALKDMGYNADTSKKGLKIDAEKLSRVVLEMLDNSERKREIFLTFVERIDIFQEHIIIKLKIPQEAANNNNNSGNTRTLPMVDNSPRWANEISPGRRDVPPPQTETELAVKCTVRNGRFLPSFQFIPKVLRISSTSVNSSSQSGGRMLFSALARRVFPLPGEPTSKIL